MLIYVHAPYRGINESLRVHNHLYVMQLSSFHIVVRLTWNLHTIRDQGMCKGGGGGGVVR